LDYDLAAEVALNNIPTLEIRDVVPSINTSSPIYLRGKSHVPLVRNRANRVYVDPLHYEAVGVQKAEEIPTIMYLGKNEASRVGFFGLLPATSGRHQPDTQGPVVDLFRFSDFSIRMLGIPNKKLGLAIILQFQDVLG
jgi:hypothetical protein